MQDLASTLPKFGAGEDALLQQTLELLAKNRAMVFIFEAARALAPRY